MPIQDRYASSINSSNLRNGEVKGYEGQSTQDTTLLGAMGLAARALEEGRVVTGPGTFREVKPAPLSAPLARVLAGDHLAVRQVLETLGTMAFEQSWVLKVKIDRVQALDMARACYAWYRHGTCKPCGGHGKTMIPGTKSLSDHDCQPCRGTGKLAFEKAFRHEHRELARWVVAEFDRQAGRAFGIAAQKIAPSLEI